MKKLFLMLIIFLISISFASAQVYLESSVDGHGQGRFIAGISDTALDTIDSSDGFLLEVPSESLALYSLVDGKNLMLDFHSVVDTGDETIWHIIQKASRDMRVYSGQTQTITWQNKFPSYYSVTFVDHGVDSTFSDIINSTQLSSFGSYQFLPSLILGNYRYFSLIVKKVTDCPEAWACGYWSTCSSGSQTRTCYDNNVCSTITSRPSLTQSCGEPTPPSVVSSGSVTVSTGISSDSSSSSGTHSSSRGSSQRSIVCIPSWQCSVWSECQSSKQSRDCFDLSNCNNDSTHPSESQVCENVRMLQRALYSENNVSMVQQNISSQAINVNDSLLSSEPKADIFTLTTLLYIVILLLANVLMLLVVFVLFKKAFTRKKR